MRDLTGSYTLPFTLAGLLLIPAALSAFSIQEHTYSARAQGGPATINAVDDHHTVTAIARDRSSEDEVITLHASMGAG
jgi:hypothetical protein